MTWRALKSIVAVIAGWATVTYISDLARWLRMRDLSNPDRYPPAPRGKSDR